MMSDDFSQAALSTRLEKLAVRYNAPSTTQSRAAAAMNEIKALILQDNLAPGDPLPTEAKLEKRLGVSRSSVREAVRKLEALDIVEVRHGSGSFVGPMSLEPMVETLALRASLSAAGGADFLLEVAQARRTLDLGLAPAVVAHYQGNPDPVLDELVDTMIEKAEAGEGFMPEDIHFHDTMIGALGNELMRQTYSSFWLVHSSILPDLVTDTSGKAVPTAKAHRAMLDAAYAGDLEAYLEAVDAHYKPLQESLAALVEN